MTADLVTLAYLHPGVVAESFASSKEALLFHDAAHHQRILSHSFGILPKRCGSGGIVDGRNDIARAMLEHSTADWLMMIDSDMGFDPDMVDRLIESADPEERPIVGALAFAVKTDGDGPHGCPRYRCQPTVYDFYEDDERVGFVPRFDYERNALVKSAATGAACILIHRNVLAAVQDKYGPVWFDTIRHPKGPHFSEDLAFSVRATACGFPIHVDTSVKTSHDKGVVCFDEEWYLAQQSIGRIPPPPPGRPDTSGAKPNRAERRRHKRKAST